MAKKLDKFPEQLKTRTYPWHEWTDGDVWEVVQGEDFTCKVHGFCQALYGVGKSRNLKVRTSRPTDREGVVIFQFFTEEKEPSVN